MNRNKVEKPSTHVRLSQRIHSLREISIEYEGFGEPFNSRPPDISVHGMFINTQRRLPVGAVLNLRIRLDRTNVEFQTRCEVRYCLPGVGVGVEFVHISQDAIHSIEKEITLGNKKKMKKIHKNAR